MGTCHCLHISFSLLIWQIVKQSETRMHRTLIVRRASCLGSNGHEQAWLWAFNVHFSKQIRKDLRCCWICKENENVMKLLLFEVWRWQRKALFEWNFFPHKRKLDVCVRAQLAPLSATNRIQTKSWKQPQLSNLNFIWSDNYNCTISMFPVLLQQPKTFTIELGKRQITKHDLLVKWPVKRRWHRRGFETEDLRFCHKHSRPHRHHQEV